LERPSPPSSRGSCGTPWQLLISFSQIRAIDLFFPLRVASPRFPGRPRSEFGRPFIGELSPLFFLPVLFPPSVALRARVFFLPIREAVNPPSAPSDLLSFFFFPVLFSLSLARDGREVLPRRNLPDRTPLLCSFSSSGPFPLGPERPSPSRLEKHPSCRHQLPRSLFSPPCSPAWTRGPRGRREFPESRPPAVPNPLRLTFPPMRRAPALSRPHNSLFHQIVSRPSPFIAKKRFSAIFSNRPASPRDSVIS